MSDELDVLNNDDEQKKRALLATALAPTGFPQMSAVVPPPSGGIPPVVGPKINPVNPHATELDRLTNPEKMSSKAGWQQIKNPFLKTLAGIGSTVGGLVAPGVAAAIPGTSMHHNVLVNQQEGLLNQDVKRGQVEAATAEDTANAAHLNAETAGLGKPKPATNGVELFQQSPDQLDKFYETKETHQPDKGVSNPQAGYAAAIADALKRGVDPNTDPHVMAWRGAIEATQKEANPNDFEKYYQGLLKGGLPDTPQNRLKAHKDWEIRPVQPGAEANRNDNRMDKSYQYNAGALSKLGDPIEQLAGRMGRLKDTIFQSTPQADALVAPELLTVMAGGQGSGLRMNEAEISRVIGGRTNLESIKAALNKWQTDPSKGLSITPAQRQQIGALIQEVDRKLQQKRNVIESANEQLINAPDVETHRRIVAGARKSLADIDAGAGGGEGDFSVQAPNGKTYHFKDQASLDKFKSAAGIK